MPLTGGRFVNGSRRPEPTGPEEFFGNPAYVEQKAKMISCRAYGGATIQSERTL
jgi:hypothetical protein